MGKDFKRIADARGSSRDAGTNAASRWPQGALGLSSGLEYEVGSYDGHGTKVVALSKIAAGQRRCLHDAYPR